LLWEDSESENAAYSTIDIQSVPMEGSWKHLHTKKKEEAARSFSSNLSFHLR